jgi:hypothetical protein
MAVGIELSGVQPSGLEHERECVGSTPAIRAFLGCLHHFSLQPPCLPPVVDGDAGWDSSLPKRISLGGDTTLTYAEMISALQQVQPSGDPVRRSRLLSIPIRLLFLLSFPLLLRPPKPFEAVFRMSCGDTLGYDACPPTPRL